MNAELIKNPQDDIELLKLYPAIVYHSIMQGNGNNCNVIFDQEVIDYHSLTNADEEEQSKYPNVRFGESCGKVLLHTDYRFSPIFKEITGHVKQYLEEIVFLKNDLFDYYITKSWYSFLYPYEYTGFKKRECSDITFVYYPKVLEGTPPFCVSNVQNEINNINEIFSGAFSENDKGLKFIKEYNLISHPFNQVKPQTGSILIYPSRIPSGIMHLGMSEQYPDEESVIIQGEIKLAMKPNVTPVEDGLLSPDLWRKFNS